jgi:hypothetical protein
MSQHCLISHMCQSRPAGPLILSMCDLRVLALGVRNRRFLVSEIGSSVLRGTKANDEFDLVRAGNIVHWKTSEIRRKERGRNREFKRVAQILEDKNQACIADLSLSWGAKT